MSPVDCAVAVRPRAFSEGTEVLESICLPHCGRLTAVPRRTFWELCPDDAELQDESTSWPAKRAVSEDGSDASTELWSNSLDCSDDDASTASAASSLPLLSAHPGLNASAVASVPTKCSEKPEEPEPEQEEAASVEAAPNKKKQRRPRRRPANVWPQAKPAEGLVADEERTTLLLKNLDKSCSTSRLVEQLDTEGLRGTYDFVYAPIDFRDQRTFGYAFLNFCTPEKAQEAARCLRAWAASGNESIEVQWTEHQGLKTQVARYQNSPVMHGSIPRHLKPMLFENGSPLEWPAPTKEIQPPRSRRRGDPANAE